MQVLYLYWSPVVSIQSDTFIVCVSKTHEYGNELSENNRMEINTNGSLGEREMPWKHKQQAGVSTDFSNSPKLLHVCR